MLQGVCNTLVIPAVFTMALIGVVLAMAQEMGAEAEMDRLEQRAEQLIAQGDAEGASLTIGKAAMMAAELAKQEQKAVTQDLYKATQRLFRAQEQVFRAIALFERAGGTPPASSGVCHELKQASQKFGESRHGLQSQELNVPHQSNGARVRQRLSTAMEREMTVQELREDFDCRLTTSLRLLLSSPIASPQG